MLFTTLVCANHLALAAVLSESVKQHMPVCKFVLCLLEKEWPASIKPADSFDEVILAKDTGMENFNHTIFKYTQYEASGSCKGQLMRYLYQKYPEENYIVFLDADTLVYDDFQEVRKAFKTHSILLTPHLVCPSSSIGNEFSMIFSGVFNTGFFALKRSKDAKAFIDWWAKRLTKFSFTDPARGLHSEQKWTDLVPVYFDHVYYLKHPGYNVAFWNLFERYLSKREGKYLVNGKPLKLFHFSNAHHLKNMLSVKNDQFSILGKELLNHYEKLLEQHRHYQMIHTDWSYHYFDNGQSIPDWVREYFKSNEKLREKVHDPYKESEKVCGL